MNTLRIIENITMRTLALSLIPLVFAPLCCLAEEAKPTTCTTFRTDLEARIIEAGQRVSLPSNIHVGYTRPDGSLIRYEFDGPVEAKGDLFCEGPDVFTSVVLNTALDATGHLNNDDRIARAVAFGAAGLCAIAPATAAQCDALARAVLKDAKNELRRSEQRGDRVPRGSEERRLYQGRTVSEKDEANVAKAGSLAITILKDGILVTVAAPAQTQSSVVRIKRF